MTCPECHRTVLFADARARSVYILRNEDLHPRSYFRRATIPSVVSTILFVVKTFPCFVKSPASFPLFMLWLVLVFGVLNVAILLLDAIGSASGTAHSGANTLERHFYQAPVRGLTGFRVTIQKKAQLPRLLVKWRFSPTREAPGTLRL